jgi:hypothetical protein
VSSVLIHKASELRPQTRAALEAELGRRLQDNEQVSIMVFVPHEAPTGKARREAGHRLEEHLNRIDEKTKTVPEAEMEAALDEALRSVRPGYRERERDLFSTLMSWPVLTNERADQPAGLCSMSAPDPMS